MQGQHITPCHDDAQQEAMLWDLVIGHHEALDDLLDGLDMAIKAVGELERLPRKEPGSIIEKAVGYGKLLRTIRDGLQRAMPPELVDVDAVWGLSLGSMPRNGLVKA